MKPTAVLAASLSVLALTACAGTSPGDAPQASASAAPIEAARLSRHVQILSSDAYEGRGPATPGEAKTVAYLEHEFAAVGLQPGGPGGSWTQDVPLGRFEITGPVKLSLTAGGRTETLTQGDQVAIRASQLNIDRVSIANAPLVFLGYGVQAPERNWDDIKGQDLRGKIGIVLINDPDFETGQGDFGGKAMTYYGRWTYKYEEAARLGLKGLLIVHETAPASYGWATVKNSNTNVMFDIVRERPAEAHPMLEGWMQREVAVDLFRRSGQDFEALKRQAQTRAFQPVALSGATLSADYAVDHRTIVSKNVIGRLPGRTRPNETMIYSAHWDHLGVGQPDAKGDRIYNGAVDNATGIAALIELGRKFAAGPRPERSVAFLAVTAEEKGLLGSTYYAAHPVYPLATTVGVLNMDSLGVNGRSRDMSTSGDAPLTLQDELVAALRGAGRRFSPDPEPGAGHFYRSDHFPMAKVGVPALSVEPGRDLVNGGTAAGGAAHDAYVRDRYHQPADQWSADWDLSGQVEDLELLYRLGFDLAQSRRWPEWKAGAEFAAVRNQSAASRR